MTEEKKQEIIKSFKSCVIDKNGDCTDCTYDNHRIHCGKKDLMQDVFELIQYQQAEIERLTERENDLVEDKAHWIGKWKEQIEYTAELQKQIDELTVKVKSFELTDLCKEAYIQQLKEENKELVSAKVFELETENAKLQKQMDELKEEMRKIESAENETYMLGFEDGEKKAKKDTSKEILQKIMNIIKKSGGFLAEELVRIWAKQNDVEVDE